MKPDFVYVGSTSINIARESDTIFSFPFTKTDESFKIPTFAPDSVYFIMHMYTSIKAFQKLTRKHRGERHIPPWEQYMFSPKVKSDDVLTKDAYYTVRPAWAGTRSNVSRRFFPLSSAALTLGTVDETPEYNYMYYTYPWKISSPSYHNYNMMDCILYYKSEVFEDIVRQHKYNKLGMMTITSLIRSGFGNIFLPVNYIAVRSVPEEAGFI